MTYPTRNEKANWGASHRWFVLAGMALLLLVGISRQALGDVAFIRGDTNSDGTVSMADSHFLLSYLFREGVVMECQDTGDANDDGSVNLADAVQVLNYLVLGGPALCDPFPEVGEDESGDSLPCSAYGGGEPLDDPLARIELEDAVADEEGRVRIRVLVSSSTEIAGYFGVASVEGDVLANRQSTEPTDLTGTMDSGFLGVHVVNGGKLHFGFLTSFVDFVALPPGEDVVVLEASVCLTEGTPPGEYALTLDAGELIDPTSGRAIRASLQGATITVPTGLNEGFGCPFLEDPSPRLECGGSGGPGPQTGCEGLTIPTEPHLDFLRGDANVDGRVSLSDALTIRRFLFNCDTPPPCLDAADVADDGSVNVVDVVYTLNTLFFGGEPPALPFPEVGSDPAEDDLSCAEYTIVEPEETDDVIAIGSVTGSPGKLVEIPVYVSNSVEIEAFQLIVRHDGALVPEPDGNFFGLSFDGTFYEDLDTQDSVSFVLVAPGPLEGYLTVPFIPSLIHTGFETPPGQERHVFNIVARVSPDAEEGGVVSLDPTAASSGEGLGAYRLRNELTFQGDARFVGSVPQSFPGLLKIVPDITIFRGDANDDGEVQMADAVYVLDYLFLGGRAPVCPDAADANDDGILNIADPVTILLDLFVGSTSIAGPYPEYGEDPTPDALGECNR